ncbi:hypothetical protein G7Y89_g7079 [Cudoniella acicularis]|uniref:Uncharacterized protein n=1 Tax=Cudoniella acicularis TaxID=354080 RepID=A0A8H4RJ71_9HELO|nr:hypothetical protein G7Y89_g7079 [Cudoniella acicularis]
MFYHYEEWTREMASEIDEPFDRSDDDLICIANMEKGNVVHVVEVVSDEEGESEDTQKKFKTRTINLSENLPHANLKHGSNCLCFLFLLLRHRFTQSYADQITRQPAARPHPSHSLRRSQRLLDRAAAPAAAKSAIEQPSAADEKEKVAE